MQDYESRDPKDVGQALTWLRHERRLTQQEVVARAGLRSDGISKIYYSQIERGVRKPSTGKLDVILGALGASEHELKQVLDSPPWTTPPQSTPLPSRPQSPELSKVRMRSASPKPASLWDDTLGAAIWPASSTRLPEWTTENEEATVRFARLSKGKQINVLALLRKLDDGT